MIDWSDPGENVDSLFPPVGKVIGFYAPHSGWSDKVYSFLMKKK